MIVGPGRLVPLQDSPLDDRNDVSGQFFNQLVMHGDPPITVVFQKDLNQAVLQFSHQNVGADFVMSAALAKYGIPPLVVLHPISHPRRSAGHLALLCE